MNKLTSTNPANNAAIGEVAITTPVEIANLVKQAHAAKSNWRFLGVKKRVELLKEIMHAFKKRENEIAMLTTQEMGKTTTEAHEGLTFDFAFFESFLKDGPKYIEDEVTVKEGRATLHKIVYEPYGVVAAIAPWNFPLSNFLWAVIPNLVVGNTVICKMSEECPLSGKLFADIIHGTKLLPSGVFAEIYGGKDVGQALISQNINLIHFTGSSAAGKKIYEVAGQKQIKAVLEMGGSNPGIVFDDADLTHAVPSVYHERFSNCGQVCDALKRLIVHRSIYKPFVEQLTAYIAKMKVGDPSKENTDLGPLAAMRQLTLLESQVNDSVKSGATVVTGGSRPKDLTGAYYLPTLMTDVKTDMRVWREEVFGPVLPVIAFDTEEQAIALANDTIYGLGAYVYTKDKERAQRVALHLEAGSVVLNKGTRWRPCNPFGGYKASGMGREHGRIGFQELCQVKVIAQ